MPDNLALRMRPKTIDQVIGQEHLVGPGKIIRRMVEANRLSSMILYGPPGIGKTSIASAIAGTTKYAFRTFNATVDSKKRLQEIAEEAKFSVALYCYWTRFIVLTRPSKTFSCLSWKVDWSL